MGMIHSPTQKLIAAEMALPDLANNLTRAKNIGIRPSIDAITT